MPNFSSLVGLESRSGLKVPGGVVGWGGVVEANFSVQLKPKAS